MNHKPTRLLITVGLLLAAMVAASAAAQDPLQIVKRLASKEKTQQWGAIVDLWSVDASAVPGIALMLKDKDPQIRLAAARALGEVKEKSAAGPLAAALKDTNGAVRLQAVQSLQEYAGPASVPALMEALKDRNVQVVRAALGMLTRIGDSKAAPAVAALLSTKDRSIRLGALWFLSNHGFPKAYAALLKLTRNKDVETAAAATEALGATRDPRATAALVKLIKSRNPLISSTAVAGLRKTADPKAKPVLDSLLKAGKLDGFHEMSGSGETIRVVIPSPSQSKEALHSSDVRVRRQAADSLSSTGDPKFFDLIAPLVRDKDRQIADSAVYYLCGIKDGRSDAYLLEAWKLGNDAICDVSPSTLTDEYGMRAVKLAVVMMKDANPRRRAEAATILKELKAVDAFDVLLAAMSDSSAEVRSAAAEGLGRIGNPRAMDALIKAVGDEDDDVAGSAAFALGNLRSKQAVPSLITLLNDRKRDGSARHYAAWALGDIGDKLAVASLVARLSDGDSDVRGGAALALGVLRDQSAVEPLMKALKDPDERVRSSAAQALGAIGDNRAYNALIVAVKDKDDLVRSAAIRSLGELGDTRAFDILAKMADNGEKPTDAVAAADALATMGDPRAYPHIVPLLYLSDPVMGASVASALARIGDKRAVRPLIGAIQKGWVVREGTLVCGCEEPFRDAAAEALMEMNDAEGNAFLLSALKQGDLAVVQGASRFFISQGVPGSEQTLLKVLNSTGMAEDFARCGNPVLSEAGKAWLYDHPDVQGTYDDVPDTSPVQWGSKTGM